MLGTVRSIHSRPTPTPVPLFFAHAGAVPLCLAPGFSNSGGTIGFWHAGEQLRWAAARVPQLQVLLLHGWLCTVSCDWGSLLVLNHLLCVVCAVADTDKAICSDQVPWCAVSSTGLQLDAGPAPLLCDPEAEQDPCSTISMAINLLSCSSSIVTHSTVRSHSSMRKPSSNSAAGHKHGLEQHTHASTLAISTSSIMYSLEDLPVVSAGSAVLSPARKPIASPTAAVPIPAQATAPTAVRMSSAAWSPVVSNPMMLPLKRLKLSTAAAAINDSTLEPPASPAASAVIRASFVCPPAPKRPPPAVVLVPLSELGSVAAA